MEPVNDNRREWSTPDPLPPLSVGAVHVWRVWLDAPDGVIGELSCLVSEEERGQAARFHTADLARRFIVRRARLRQILGAYLDVAPGDIRFVRGQFGKPRLAPPLDASGIHFSASHSGQLALVAEAAHCEIGVDVERVRPLPELEDLCRRCFAAEEREVLDRLAGEARLAAFYRGWVRKEAVLKALGVGLSVAMDRVIVSLEPGARASVFAIEASEEAASTWRLEDVSPADQCAAALAVPAPRREILCYEWS